jgi:hypothetical protein
MVCGACLTVSVFCVPVVCSAVVSCHPSGALVAEILLLQSQTNRHLQLYNRHRALSTSRNVHSHLHDGCRHGGTGVRYEREKLTSLEYFSSITQLTFQHSLFLFSTLQLSKQCLKYQDRVEFRWHSTSTVFCHHWQEIES